MRKTVFISSTFQDLAEHRRAVWSVLKKLGVAFRGMEDFGARPEAPLATCLAEVTLSDVCVCIVAYRVGSVHSESCKSFTQLEYEHARQLNKDLLIYLADEHAQQMIRYDDIDVDPTRLGKLNAFKHALQENHTVNFFTSPEDLAEKLERDLRRQLVLPPKGSEELGDELDESLRTVRRFLLTPKPLIGREIRLRVRFRPSVFPAARGLCKAFNLEYGATVGAWVSVIEPESRDMEKFQTFFASRGTVDQFLTISVGQDPVDLYASLQFCEENVDRTNARFFGFTSYPWDAEPDEEGEYFPPEGMVILLFTKLASS